MTASPTNTIRIKVAMLNIERLTLFKENGEEIYIQQGDKRLSPILEFISEPISSQGYVDLPIEYLEQPNIFHEFEKENKFVRFFRVPKKVLSKVFGSKESLMPRIIGNFTNLFQDVKEALEPEQESVKLPEMPDHKVVRANASGAKSGSNKVSKEAIGEIMANAKKSETDAFTRNIGENNSEDTIVAITDTGAMIPEAHLLAGQIDHANNNKNAKGFQNFLNRLTPIIDKRGHSVEELLKFMERGDLPIADDGSIIAYKLLYKTDGGRFVDPHSRRVSQTIGSYVNMDAKNVDGDRRRDCSNGLHVARRGYLKGFGGDSCFIIKIAPEDVISVPEYDANKMRVCGYHILFHLTNDMMYRLKSNKSITNTVEGKTLLSRAISGDHIRKTESVFISGNMGTKVTITPLDEDGNPIVEQGESIPDNVKPIQEQITNEAPAPSVEATKPVEKLVEAIPDECQKVAETANAPKMDVKSIQDIGKKATEKRLSGRVEEARKLFDRYSAAQNHQDKKDYLQHLLTFKQSKKVSWTVLGFDPKEESQIKKAIERLLK